MPHLMSMPRGLVTQAHPVLWSACDTLCLWMACVLVVMFIVGLNCSPYKDRSQLVHRPSRFPTLNSLVGDLTAF